MVNVCIPAALSEINCAVHNLLYRLLDTVLKQAQSSLGQVLYLSYLTVTEVALIFGPHSVWQA